MVTKRNRSPRALSRQKRTVRWLTVLGLGFGALLIVSFFFDEMGVAKYLTMRKHAQQLEREIYSLERSNAALRREIFRIQHDETRIEELARERLGLVRKGETVYQIVQPAQEHP